MVNRLQWESGGQTRVRAGLHFGGVLKVQSHKVKLGAGEAVVSLLAVTFLRLMAPMKTLKPIPAG